MFCKKCGTEYADTERFCPQCGTQAGGAVAGKKGSSPLFMAATIVQSVAVLFALIFCFQAIGDINDSSSWYERLDMGYVPPLATLIYLCAAAAVVFVLVCLWLLFAGKQGGNVALTAQSKKLLSISLLVQLIVESVFYGLVFLYLMACLFDSDMGALLRAADAEGQAVLLVLGVLIMAASVILLHVFAMKAAKTGVADSATSVMSFVAGGVHLATLLILFVMGSGVSLVGFFMLSCLGAADIIYGIIGQKQLAK